jgi:hypothetical protein
MPNALSIRRYHPRVVGLSRNGKIAAGALLAVAAAQAVYKRRERIRQAFRGAPQKFRAAGRVLGRGAYRLGLGATFNAAGPYVSEAIASRRDATKRGVSKNRQVVIPLGRLGRALGYGAAGHAAGAATIPIAAGIGGGLAGPPGAAAGALIGSGLTYGAATAAYLRNRGRKRQRVIVAPSRKSGTGASSAG